MRFAQATEYAIDSLVYLGLNTDRGPVLVDEVARRQGISASYLAKVFQRLVRAGLLRSTRGAHGGFELARDPSKITLGEVVRITEGDSPLYECSPVTRQCGLEGRCIVVGAFREAEEAVFDILGKVTLRDTIERVPSGHPWREPAPAQLARVGT